MSAFDHIAEQKIRAAIDRGDFDELAYRGRPLPEDRLADLPPELRTSARLMSSTGYLPEEVLLRRRLRELDELLRHCEEADGRPLLDERRRKAVELEMLLERRGVSPAARRVVQQAMQRRPG